MYALPYIIEFKFCGNANIITLFVENKVLFTVKIFKLSLIFRFLMKAFIKQNLPSHTTTTYPYVAEHVEKSKHIFNNFHVVVGDLSDRSQRA